MKIGETEIRAEAEKMLYIQNPRMAFMLGAKWAISQMSDDKTEKLIKLRDECAVSVLGMEMTLLLVDATILDECRLKLYRKFIEQLNAIIETK